MRIGLISIVVCAVFFSSLAEANEWITLFSTDWSTGIDERIQYQEPESESIKIVNMNRSDLGKAMRIIIKKNDNYSNVANGSPRAEISFNGFVHFQQNREYFVDWEMYIPVDYKLDGKQPELVSQIHQGPAAGYPPFALFFSENGRYEVHSRTQSKFDYVSCYFGRVADDIGRVVKWELHYIPDGTGANAVTELFKDGKVVFATKGIPNSYSDDDGGYLKLGIYKAEWNKVETDVDVRTMYYGDVSIRVAREN